MVDVSGAAGMRRIAAALAVASALAVSACGGGADKQDPARAGTADLKAEYERAARYLPWKIGERVRGMKLEPHWSADGAGFWFERQEKEGATYVQVNWQDGPPTVAELASAPAEPAPADTPGDLDVSPNGRWAVRVVDGNLHRIDMATGRATALTTDAEPDYVYSLVPHSDLRSLSKRLANDPPIPYGLWSPEGDRYLTYRVDERGLYKLPFVVSIVPGAEHQVPWVHYQNTAWPDSPKVQQAELMVFDMRDGRRTDLQIPKPIMAFVPTPEGGLRWSPDGRKVFAAPETPDYKTLTVYEADAATGRARPVARDEAELTFRPDVDEAKRFQLVGNGEEIILYSERSDWGHFYLYDGASGTLKNAITQGDWAVHDLKRVDSQGRWLYFTAGGREAGHDPYYSHLYRVRLDGSELTLLTPENAQHEVRFSPDGRYFIDTYSTPDTPPVTVLRASDGRDEPLELLRADVSGLEALGWTPPQRFTVKSADGRTDLYGVLFLPADFDPERSYPLVESQYTGTQVLYAPRTFLAGGPAIALAQLGFAVMMFDGRATPYRSQSMQDLGFGKALADPIMLEDHVAAIRQLAERHGFIDAGRVGIYGHSWGGYRAARALLQFPDVYKVGVATAGSHDNYLFVYGHNRWYGRPQDYPDSYRHQTNMELADKLQGRLLLMHGANDDDVHVALTLQLADALIRHNKDFDMFIHPTLDHKNFWQDGYVIRKSWDYFVQHLQHRTPPREANVPGYEGKPYRRPMHPPE